MDTKKDIGVILYYLGRTGKHCIGPRGLLAINEYILDKLSDMNIELSKTRDDIIGSVLEHKNILIFDAIIYLRNNVDVRKAYEFFSLDRKTESAIEEYISQEGSSA